MKYFLLVTLLFFRLAASAEATYDFICDGIEWHILDSENRFVEAVGCESTLTSVVIPSTVECCDRSYTVLAIGDSAFFSLSHLKDVEISNSVHYIGPSAFENCSLLSSITIPPSVTKIGDSAFCNCISIQDISLPPTINIIEPSTFKNCSSLQSFDIPLSVNLICANAFENCSSLLQLDIPASVNEIAEYAFAGCTRLQNINIPLSIRYISKGIFRGCTSLTEIILPQSVSYIGESAFEGCDGIKHISIPMSIRSIGSKAFFADSIESVDYHAAVPQYFGAQNIFSENTYHNATLYVPEGSESLAGMIRPWANFSHISTRDFSEISHLEPEPANIKGIPRLFNLQGQPIPNHQADHYSEPYILKYKTSSSKVIK